MSPKHMIIYAWGTCLEGCKLVQLHRQDDDIMLYIRRTYTSPCMWQRLRLWTCRKCSSNSACVLITCSIYLYTTLQWSHRSQLRICMQLWILPLYVMQFVANGSISWISCGSILGTMLSPGNQHLG